MRDYTKQSRAGLFYIHISTNTGPGTYTYMPELLFICGDIYIYSYRKAGNVTHDRCLELQDPEAKPPPSGLLVSDPFLWKLII